MLYNLRIRPNFIFLPIFIFAFCLLVEGQNKQANKLNILVLDDYTYEGIGNVDLQKASISKLSIGCRGRNLKFLRLNNDQIYCVFYDSE